MFRTLVVAAVIGLTVGSFPAPILTPAAYAADCVARNNLGETAASFIARCRQGGINREFPGQHLGDTLGSLDKGRSATQKKAWKLLNDGRFAK